MLGGSGTGYVNMIKLIRQMFCHHEWSDSRRTKGVLVCRKCEMRRPRT